MRRDRQFEARMGVIDAGDVGLLLGVSRGRARQIFRTDRSFPRPVQRATLWYRSGIQVWAAAHRPGRGSAVNPFAAGPAALLLHAERAARDLGAGYVASEPLWIGFWQPGVDDRVARVLGSLGVSEGHVRRAVAEWAEGVGGHRDGSFMNPHVQTLFDDALRRARAREAAAVDELDVALAIVDQQLRGIAEARPATKTHPVPRRKADGVLLDLEERGLDPRQLLERLEAARADRGSIDGFEKRTLRPRRKRRRAALRKPPWLGELAPNPLGHDPWDRLGWGSVFFLTPQGRHYKVDGYQWFFHIDRDGYPVRTRDGRPVGYRWRVLPLPPATESVMDFEVLPMPPDPVSNWPDQRYGKH